MLQRLGHARRLVTTLQRRHLAESGIAGSLTCSKCRCGECRCSAHAFGRAEHTSTAAAAAGAPHVPEEASADDAQRRAAVNRLLYRAKQRGFLELDLLVGLWAERNVPHLSMSELTAFEEVLDIENPDLFKWLTGQEAAPEALRDNASFMVRQKLQTYIARQANACAMSVGTARTKGGFLQPWLLVWDLQESHLQLSRGVHAAVQMLQSDVQQQIAEHRPSTAQTRQGTAWVRPTGCAACRICARACSRADAAGLLLVSICRPCVQVRGWDDWKSGEMKA